MKRLPRRYFLVPEGPINEIIAEAFPEAQPQWEMPALKNSKKFIINFSWELTAEQLIQLKKFCLDRGIKFDFKIWVKCGDNPIHPTTEPDWNPAAQKGLDRRRKVRAFVRRHTQVVAGKFPHRIYYIRFFGPNSRSGFGPLFLL